MKKNDIMVPFLGGRGLLSMLAGKFSKKLFAIQGLFWILTRSGRLSHAIDFFVILGPKVEI